MSAGVARNIHATISFYGEPAHERTVSFLYNPTDPYAVTLHWDHIHVWTFARSILVDAFNRGRGGDAISGRVTASTWTNGLFLVNLKNEHGHIVLVLDADPVRAAVAATLEQVPAGTETGHIDWQHTMRTSFRFLGEAR